LPPNSQFTTTSPTPVALGEEISMECHPHYVAWMLEGVGEWSWFLKGEKMWILPFCPEKM
jgi:hypothetical protein